MESPSVDLSPAGIESLLQAANALPFGAARIALGEEAVRSADLLNDVRLAYRARQDLVVSTQFGGRPDLTLVAFTWCIAQV